MTNDERHTTDEAAGTQPGPASLVTDDTDNVVDIGTARAQRKTKAQKVLEVLKTFAFRTTKNGEMVVLEASGEVLSVKSKAFIDKVRKVYFGAHHEGVSQKVIEDAFAYFDAKAPETDAAVTVVAEKNVEQTPSQTDLLVQLALTKAEFFRDDQDTPFATIAINGYRESLKVRSTKFRAWLDREFFQTFNKVPGGQAKTDALGALEGFALYEGPLYKVHRRTAGVGGTIFVDLANEAREIVEVTGNGWRVVSDAPVKFLRPKGLLPLPRPEVGGSIDELRPFFNLKEEHHFKLLVAWLVAALRPSGPYPILNLQAEHGSGKSTASRLARALVDPNVSPIRSVPKETRDLAIACAHSHVLAYDNLSGVPIWLSDALCRVATGGGFSTRALYTDDEEVIFDAVRPVILNGIDDIATRPDLADRCLLITLPKIPKSARRVEKKLFAEFEIAAPRIFGALLTGLAGALGREATIELEELPRMADFVIFATAAERGLGWEDGAFLAAYTANQEQAVASSLDADVVTAAIVKLLETAENNAWNGAPSSLFMTLSMHAPDEIRRSKNWPRAANALTNRIRRLAPFLRATGIEVEEARDNAQRTITLRGKNTKPANTNQATSVGAQSSVQDDRGCAAGPRVRPSMASNAARPGDELTALSREGQQYVFRRPGGQP